MLKLVKLTQSAYPTGSDIRDWYFLLDTDDKLYSILGMYEVYPEFIHKLAKALGERIEFQAYVVQMEYSTFIAILSIFEYKAIPEK